jgi:hypothetical protein
MNTEPIFKARVIDQMVTTRQGDPRIILTIKVLGKLRNVQDPTEGVDECPPSECDVWITLPHNNEERLGMAMRDLERLGFAGDDISRLHPDHPDAFRLLDKDVHVRRKVVGDVEYWNLAWPREKPKPVGVAEMQQAAAPLKAKISALRRKKASASSKN